VAVLLRPLVHSSFLLAILAFASCSDGDESVRVIANGTAVGTVGAAADPPSGTSPAPPDPLPFAPTSPTSTLDAANLTGFGYPVEDGCLPGFDGLMPNAPRPGRNGAHAGIDWYPGSACAAIGAGTPVLAMYDGVVVRADHEYVGMTLAELQDLEARIASVGRADAKALDLLHGRQVWIDHGQGVVSRYAHMSEIPARIFVGLTVRRSEVVGLVGNSGTPESVTAPGTEVHLHAELRVGDGFLGAALAPDLVRALYERLFTPLLEATPAAGG
jgi:murein DD-endopeptidase MepM/ murein hydrolase activator NlpD